MKKRVFVFWGLTILSVLTLWGNPIPGNPIPIEGSWGPGSGHGPRSIILVPAPPIAFTEKGELEIYFTDTLSDLLVIVSDSNGAVVFQDLVSGDSDYTLIIQLSPGSYELTMAHKVYGILTGEFEVE